MQHLALHGETSADVRLRRSCRAVARAVNCAKADTLTPEPAGSHDTAHRGTSVLHMAARPSSQRRDFGSVPQTRPWGTPRRRAAAPRGAPGSNSKRSRHHGSWLSRNSQIPCLTCRLWTSGIAFSQIAPRSNPLSRRSGSASAFPHITGHDSPLKPAPWTSGS